MNNLKKYIIITDKLIEFLKENKFFSNETMIPVIENIEEINSKLKKRKYTVAVIAAMKAGKSTVFNAVLGEDILPNETNACTVAMTEIKYSNKNPCKFEKYYCNGKKIEVNAESREILQQKFLNDIRQSRKKGEIDDIEKYYIEHSYEALKDNKYEGVVDNFILIDTPGPNEASNGNFDTKKLKKIAYFQLRNADAIIFLLDYQVYKSETNAILLKDIFAGREDLKKDNEKIFFVVNKLDSRNSKDGTKEQILENVKQMIVHQTEGVINNPNIIGISALKAVYGRTIKNNNITEKNLLDCNKKYSAEYEKKIVIDGEEYSKKLKGDELAYKLIQDSNIEEFENLAIVNTFVKSSSKMIKGSTEIIKNKLLFLGNEIQAKIDIQSKDISELVEGIDNSKREIEKLILESKFMFDQIKNDVDKLNHNMAIQINTIGQDIKENIQNVLNEYKDYYESTDRSSLEHVLNSLNRDCRNVAENFVLRKQDEFMRLYNKYKQSITNDIYCAINMLSKRTDNILKVNLDVDINTSGMIFEKYTEQTIYNSTSINSFKTGDTGVPDKEFNKQLKRGLTGAGEGAALGYTVGGPIGALIGGIGGFLFGVGTEENTAIQEQIKYKINVVEIKINLLKQFSKNGNNISKDFEKYLENEKIEINKNIDNLMNNYLEQINTYLNSLLNEFEIRKDQREKYILELNNLLKKINYINNMMNN